VRKPWEEIRGIRFTDAILALCDLGARHVSCGAD
jgi:hypothetical protein